MSWDAVLLGWATYVAVALTVVVLVALALRGRQRRRVRLREGSPRRGRAHVRRRVRPVPDAAATASPGAAASAADLAVTPAPPPMKDQPRVAVGDTPRRRHVPAVSISSAHAAVSADVAAAPGLRAVAASVVGRDHLARALAREDAYAVHRLGEQGGPGLCVAVTDGVSGAPWSQVYALALATAAVRTLARVWPEPSSTLLRDVARSADDLAGRLAATGSAAVAVRAQERPGVPAATLVLLTAAPSPEGLAVTWWQVGDARLGVLDSRSGEFSWISGPGGGDGHLTHAMPRHAADGAQGRWTLPFGQWLVLCSDGAAPVLEALPGEVLAAVSGRGDDLERMSRLTALLGARLEGEHDDRTVVLLTSDATA